MSKNRGQESFAILLIVLVVLGLGAWFVEDATAQGDYALDCLPELVNPRLLYVLIPEHVMVALRAMPSRGSFWIGYDNGGFDLPPDAHLLFWIRDDTNNAGVAFIGSRLTPDVLYLMVFDNLGVFADTNDEHYGIHPCAAVRVTIEDFKAALYATATPENVEYQ